MLENVQNPSYGNSHQNDGIFLGYRSRNWKTWGIVLQREGREGFPVLDSLGKSPSLINNRVTKRNKINWR